MVKKKIAFIGTGFIAQICHLPSYTKNKKVKIIAICDQNPKALKYVANKYKIKHTYKNYKNLIHDQKDLDAIILTVPRHETYKISKEILKNKINLFTEKPMALSKKSALELVNLAKKNNLIYTVGHMKRHDESIKYLKKLFLKNNFKFNSLQNVYYESFAGDSFGKLKKLIKKNKKYKSHFINFDVLKNKVPKKNKINYLKFLNTHSHAINLLRYLFGDISLQFNNINKFGDGLIGFKKQKKMFLLNARRLYSNDWHEKIIFNFEKFKVFLSFPMPMKIKQPERLSILNLKTSKSRVIRLKNSWSFANQSKSFINCLFSKKNVVNNAKNSVEDLNIIEKIFI